MPELSPRAPEPDCVGPNPYQPCDLRQTSQSLMLLLLHLSDGDVDDTICTTGGLQEDPMK